MKQISYTMNKSNIQAIKPQKLSEKDQETLKGLFAWLEPEDKRKIAKQNTCTVQYVGKVLTGERYNKTIFSQAIGIAIKNRSAHNAAIAKIKTAQA
jgi:hypothetical protein